MKASCWPHSVELISVELVQWWRLGKCPVSISSLHLSKGKAGGWGSRGWGSRADVRWVLGVGGCRGKCSSARSPIGK